MKNKTMFTLKSCNVKVYEDNYENGEGDFVNSWDLNEYNGKRFNSLHEVIDFIANNNIYDDDYTNTKYWSVCEYDEDNGTLRIDTDVLVDDENHPANENEIEKWKNGEVKLYTAHYYVYVRCEYIAVIPKNVIERKSEYIGFDLCI